MNHYTYMLIDPITDMKYIGVRSCECPIDEDTYMGSSHKMTTEEKERSDKMIIKTFDTREAAMQHEIELHDKYDVAVNPKFYNQAKATSTGFTMQGVTREPFTDEHIAKMSANRQGSGNTTYRLATVYEWVHKNGEEFTGTIEKMVKHSGKDSSSFYKIFKQKLLTASGWRVKKNVNTDVETLDAKGFYSPNTLTADVIAAREIVRLANIELKHNKTYLWVHTSGCKFIGTMYKLAEKEDKDQAIYRRHVAGSRSTASGWRIVKNMESGCVTTDLNHGRSIKVKLTPEMVK